MEPTLPNMSSDASVEEASLGRRFVAFLLDGLILLIPSFLIQHILPVLGAAALWFFYAPVLECSDMKATIGKYLMGITVTDISGRRLSFRSALIRNVVKFASSALAGLPFLFVFFSSKKQALHDLFAESIVVFGRQEANVFETWIASARNIVGSAETALKKEAKDHVIHELERLQALRERGAITDDEFEEQKRRVLSAAHKNG